MRFVEVDEARAAGGLRLVTASGIPSPWSQAAMGLFDVKGIDYLAVRFRAPGDEVKAWTGAHNVPVVVHEQEPPRTGWAEILALAERLGGRVALVPTDDEPRLRMYGLANELLGEGGLAWNTRLLITHASLTTGGREGWPLPVGQRLAPKYGYAPDRAEGARARAIATLALLGRVLAASQAHGGDYYLGPQLTAVDIYAAAVLGVIAPMPHDLCPMLPAVRHAFDTLDPTLRAAVPAHVIAHRDMMFQRHLPLPVRV